MMSKDQANPWLRVPNLQGQALAMEAKFSCPPRLLNEALLVRLLDFVNRFDVWVAAMADTKPEEPLIDQVEAVIKGVLGGKVPSAKVDELGNAVDRNKSDRAVIRSTKR